MGSWTVERAALEYRASKHLPHRKMQNGVDREK